MSMQKNRITYNRNELINKTLEILNENRPLFCRVQKDLVINILDAYEFAIKNCLKQATPEKSVMIKCLDGVQLISKWLSEREIKLNNVSMITLPRIGAKARITKYYSQKLNEN